jgi:predicted anti-sigma-YlaC factor YlaD
MDCSKLFPHLGAYLDGELELALVIEIEAHCHACPPCRTILETCRQTIQVYRRQPAPPLAPNLHRKLMDRLSAKPPMD